MASKRKRTDVRTDRRASKAQPQGKKCDSCGRRGVASVYFAVGPWKGKRLCDECIVTGDAVQSLNLVSRCPATEDYP